MKIQKPMGRPPKPPSLRIADGTHRNDRHGDKSLIGTDKAIATVPAVHAAEKREEFRSRWKAYCEAMIGAGVLTDRDLPVLEQLCDAHQLLADAEKALGGPDGHYVRSEYGTSRHPALTTVERTRNTIVTIQQLLGFGPRARAAVPPVSHAKKVDSISGRRHTPLE